MTTTVKLRLAQIEVLPGRPVDNTATILRCVESAKNDGVDLVVFPEMAVPGYLIGDEWERTSFLRECENCTEEICAASDGIVCIFGNVGIDWNKRNEDGRTRKYNALFVAENGKRVGPASGPYDFVIKTLHPNYREFDDSRHFFGLRHLALEIGRPVSELAVPVKTARLSLGCMICEDAWDADYGLSPADLLTQHGVDLLINISASPFTFDKNDKRHRILSGIASKHKTCLAYVSHTGIQNNGKTVFTFDGSSCVYDQLGNRIASADRFAETCLTVDLPAAGNGAPTVAAPRKDSIAELEAAIIYGTERFLKLVAAERVTIGISGGIDSSVAAAIYGRIMEPDNLLLVSMPGPFTSPITRELAAQLAINLGCCYLEVPIDESVAFTTRQIDGLTIKKAGGVDGPKIRLSEHVLENMQARDRSSRILAAVSQAFGGVFTCNANKAEATVGYSTFYGDLCGFLANLADLWKGEIYELARHLNEKVYGREVIPAGTITLKPSAELSPAQDIEKGLGDPLIYPYHDLLFKSWVESWDRTTPEEILEWYSTGELEQKLGYPGKLADLFPSANEFVADLERWWDLYQGLGLAKRIQAPPILAVKRRAFGFDHRESQMGSRYTRRYAELKQQLLGRTD
ncbi:MAG: NAD(+) synthase [Lentisphaerales bacterium]|jgi:NAD+ synthase (glutamine-hydrolysing)|nr:MAG: NAD(+) synthase [Lentisphaerales bacterium]